MKHIAIETNEIAASAEFENGVFQEETLQIALWSDFTKGYEVVTTLSHTNKARVARLLMTQYELELENSADPERDVWF